MKRFAIAVIGGTSMLAALLSASAVRLSATASSIKWAEVSLGSHAFGRLRAPDAIVATAGPDQVGFEQRGEGPGIGPWSFKVAPDGAIWLLDEVNHQLLVWESGRSSAGMRSLPLPSDPLESVADFALGPDGTIYATYLDYDSEAKTLGLCALAQNGEVLWTAPTNIEMFNAGLSTGPDGAVYVFGGDETQSWTRLTTPEGEPLTVDEQKQETSPNQPLAGGGELSATRVSDYEERFTQTDEAGQVVHAWRVTSGTALAFNFTKPRLVDGDLVLTPDVWEMTKTEFLWEYLVLRLSPTGEIPQQFALDHRAVWGDDLFAGLQVGPDGQLYQLSTSPEAGASIAKYSLDSPKKVTSSESAKPASAGQSKAAPRAIKSVSAEPISGGLAMTQSTVLAHTVTPVAKGGTSAASEPAHNRNLAGLAVLGTGILIALGAWVLYRRRRAARPRSGGQPRVIPAIDSPRHWPGSCRASACLLWS